MSDHFPAVLPHDPPKQIADDLFVVHGSIKMNPVVRITRNMVVVRNGTELTLISPVRMNEEGLKALEALGDIKHVMRLGPFHGLDDKFYVERYGAAMWSFEDGTTYTEPAITNPLIENGELPFPNAKLIVLGHMKETEGVIVLSRKPNVLITCDCIQTYSAPPHMPHTPWAVRKLMPLIGFPNTTLIGPFWVKLLVTDKPAIKADFARLLEEDFDQLIAAHGSFLPAGAHAEVEQAFHIMFAAAS